MLKAVMRKFDASHVPIPRLAPTNLDAEDSPVDLEIGAGQGYHAITYARSHPNRILIAIERTINRYHQLHRRHLAHGALKNLIPIHADALSIVTHILRPCTVDRIFILYPNPYPKGKQANLRWHNMPFASELLNKLKIGGELIIATNVSSYAEEAASVWTTTWNLGLEEFNPISEVSTPRTHFEKKYLARKQTCYNLRFKKNLP